MCIPIGVWYACGCDWRRWIPCVHEKTCNVQALFPSELPPLPIVPTLDTDAAKKYRSLSIMYQLFIKINWCCGPDCCQMAIDAVASASKIVDRKYYQTAETHIQYCFRKFEAGLGNLNCIRSDVDQPPRTGKSLNIIRGHLPEHCLGNDSLQILRSLDNARKDRNSRFSQGSRRPALEQYLWIRYAALEDPSNSLCGRSHANEAVTKAFREVRAQHPGDKLRAARVALDWKSLERIVSILQLLAYSGPNKRSDAENQALGLGMSKLSTAAKDELGLSAFAALSRPPTSLAPLSPAKRPLDGSNFPEQPFDGIIDPSVVSGPKGKKRVYVGPESSGFPAVSPPTPGSQETGSYEPFGAGPTAAGPKRIELTAAQDKLLEFQKKVERLPDVETEWGREKELEMRALEAEKTQLENFEIELRELWRTLVLTREWEPKDKNALERHYQAAKKAISSKDGERMERLLHLKHMEPAFGFEFGRRMASPEPMAMGCRTNSPGSVGRGARTNSSHSRGGSQNSGYNQSGNPADKASTGASESYGGAFGLGKKVSSSASYGGDSFGRARSTTGISAPSRTASGTDRPAPPSHTNTGSSGESSASVVRRSRGEDNGKWGNPRGGSRSSSFDQLLKLRTRTSYHLQRNPTLF